MGGLILFVSCVIRAGLSVQDSKKVLSLVTDLFRGTVDSRQHRSERWPVNLLESYWVVPDGVKMFQIGSMGKREAFVRLNRRSWVKLFGVPREKAP